MMGDVEPTAENTRNALKRKIPTRMLKGLQQAWREEGGGRGSAAKPPAKRSPAKGDGRKGGGRGAGGGGRGGGGRGGARVNFSETIEEEDDDGGVEYDDEEEDSSACVIESDAPLGTAFDDQLADGAASERACGGGSCGGHVTFGSTHSACVRITPPGGVASAAPSEQSAAAAAAPMVRRWWRRRPQARISRST